MALRMGEVTEFRGILPPAGANGHGSKLPPSRNTPGGLILHALSPLRHELDAALAKDDRPAALHLAYNALAEVADALALYRGDELRGDQVRIHALLVELEPLPLELRVDGTVAERGTLVNVSYRNWQVKPAEAQAWARTLAQHFQSLWPGAWFIVPPCASPSMTTAAGPAAGARP